MPVTIDGGAGVTFPDGVQQTNGVTNTGGEPRYYAARAWANIDGTGSISIRAAVNISSLIDNGTGDYSFNFTSPMPDASYSVVGANNANGGAGPGDCSQGIVSQTATRFRLQAFRSGLGPVDASIVCAAVFR